MRRRTSPKTKTHCDTQTVRQSVSHQSSDFSRSASVICFRPANTKFACTSIATTTTTTTTRSVSSFSFFSFSSTSFPSCLLVQLHWNAGEQSQLPDLRLLLSPFSAIQQTKMLLVQPLLEKISLLLSFYFFFLIVHLVCAAHTTTDIFLSAARWSCVFGAVLRGNTKSRAHFSFSFFECFSVAAAAVAEKLWFSGVFVLLCDYKSS